MTEEKCEHQKVFANYSHTTNPPQTPWICSKCGEKGMHSPKRDRNLPTFEQLEKKFKGNEIIEN